VVPSYENQPGVVLKALAKGKHVLSEKPVAPNAAEGEALVAAYNAQYKHLGLKWSVAENYRHETAWLKVANLTFGLLFRRAITFASLGVRKSLLLAS
jgi:hypothetical protein